MPNNRGASESVGVCVLEFPSIAEDLKNRQWMCTKDREVSNGWRVYVVVHAMLSFRVSMHISSTGSFLYTSDISIDTSVQVGEQPDGSQEGHILGYQIARG